jgi:hypothetical protein
MIGVLLGHLELHLKGTDTSAVLLQLRRELHVGSFEALTAGLKVNVWLWDATQLGREICKLGLLVAQFGFEFVFNLLLRCNNLLLTGLLLSTGLLDFFGQLLICIFQVINDTLHVHDLLGTLSGIEFNVFALILQLIEVEL